LVLGEIGKVQTLERGLGNHFFQETGTGQSPGAS